MAKHLILSENPAFASLLEARLRAHPHSGRNIKSFLVSAPPDSAHVESQFEELASWLDAEIENEIDGWGVPSIIVYSDLGGYGIDACAWTTPLRGGGWSQVLGLLILAFPEIHWVLFPESRLNISGNLPELQQFHSLESPENDEGIEELATSGFTPLFDPSGLRDCVRRSLHEPTESGKSNQLGIPVREECAAAVDDETSYSYLYAYAAYRFGYRAHVVRTYAMMHMLFETKSQFSPALVVEDIFLNFPDEHPVNFSKLAKREADDLCPRLRNVPRRVFVSIGLNSANREENKRFVAQAQQRGFRYKIRDKPLGGIFTFWQEAGMVHGLSRKIPRTGHGFFWPPRDAVHPAGRETPGHSAPGRLLRVAERLLGRAERMREDVASPVAAVYGAVLALDALELLADRTPTTGIDALTLKHHFEVKAECQFSGVQHHIQVAPRLEEIRRESQAISRWFRGGRRSSTALNAEMQIVNMLVGDFREYNQFDEEQQCMARARRLHNSLWIRERPWRICALPFLRYSELLLLRITNFFWAVTAWTIIFTMTFALLRRIRSESVTSGPIGQVSDAFQHAATSFLGGEVRGAGIAWQLTTIAAILIGTAHLGLLTSHLYSLSSRK